MSAQLSKAQTSCSVLYVSWQLLNLSPAGRQRKTEFEAESFRSSVRAPHSGVGLSDAANRKQRFAQPDLKRELLVPAPSA